MIYPLMQFSALSTRIFLLLALVIFSCSVFAAPACDDPPRLSFSFVPESNAQKDMESLRPLLDHISKLTGKPVDSVLPKSYGAVIEGLLSGAIDIAGLGPFSYITARKADPGITPFATLARKQGVFDSEATAYHSLLITARNGPLQTLDSVQGASLALADPVSTSGSLVPRRIFTRELGKPLEKIFSRIAYAGNHRLSALAVKNRQVDAAFVASYNLSKLVSTGEAQEGDFTVLWRSPKIPDDPFVYRSGLCKVLQDKIRAALLKMPTKAKHQVLDGLNGTHFVPVSDSDFQIIRDLEEQKE